MVLQGDVPMRHMQLLADLALSSVLAATLSLTAPELASANNVRVEDVENSSMQAGKLAVSIVLKS